MLGRFVCLCGRAGRLASDSRPSPSGSSFPGRRTLTGSLCGLGGVLRPLIDHPIDHTPLHRHLGGEEIIALKRILDLLERLAGMLDVNFVQPLLQVQDLLGVLHDVGCLALKAAGGLMEHDA